MGKKSKAAKLSTVAVAQRHGLDSLGRLGHETSGYLVNVNEQTALAVDVVAACVRILADLTADADIGEYKGTERLPDSRLTRRPMRTMTRRQWVWQTVATMALYDGCYMDRDPGGLGNDTEGVPYSIRPVAPSRVTWDGQSYAIDGERVEPERLAYIPRSSFPTVSGSPSWLLQRARSVIAAAWSADGYRSEFWQKGGTPNIQIVTDQPLTPGQADEISDRWTDRRVAKLAAPAVFGRGARAEALGVDAAAAGATSAAEALGTAGARWFGVPAWLVNVPTAAGSMTYANASAAGLDLVRYTLQPGYAGPISDYLSDELPGDYLSGRRVVLSLEHLTRGTILEQAQADQIAVGRPWKQPWEARADRHMPMDMTLDETGAPAPALEMEGVGSGNA